MCARVKQRSLKIRHSNKRYSTHYVRFMACFHMKFSESFQLITHFLYFSLNTSSQSIAPLATSIFNFLSIFLASTHSSQIGNFFLQNSLYREHFETISLPIYCERLYLFPFNNKYPMKYIAKSMNNIISYTMNILSILNLSLNIFQSICKFFLKRNTKFMN